MIHQENLWLKILKEENYSLNPECISYKGTAALRLYRATAQRRSESLLFESQKFFNEWNLS
jgi:hypothetical protein